MNPTTNDKWYQSKRTGGLRRFALAITFLNILGHTVLGFEQSWAQPLVALAIAYSTELALETVDAWAKRRTPRFIGTPVTFVDFMLSAHITGLAISMLIYANDRLWPVALAVAIAMGSKAIFRISTGNGISRHFFNPSNFGITSILLIFPWIGIAPPYHFTENVSGIVDWVLPGLIIISGTFLNFKFTEKLPLIATWLTIFIIQALFRSFMFDMPIAAALLPMTGLAFVLYTFYMVTDPATTPGTTRGQVVFGAAVAVTYSLLMTTHVVFGLFFALTAVCAARGVVIYATNWIAARSHDKVVEQSPVVVREA
jgi:Na+-translocating ferredoxin:NAD+ oxidoreductase RnfD subunit